VDREECAREVTECVNRLFFSAENQARFLGASEQLGVSPPMLKALLELAPGERVPMRDLAERWHCDASFVTVICDGLEAHGLVRRRVAEHDRRIKVVELTEAGAEARAIADREVFAPRTGFGALTEREQGTLARLLRKLTDAQADYDETLLERPEARAMARRMTAQRTRLSRGRGWSAGPLGGHGGGPHARHGPHGGPGDDAGDEPEPATWREHFEAHRRELAGLKAELARMRDEFKAQVRAPIDEARSNMKAEAKAAKSNIKAEAKAARDDMVKQLKQGRQRR
jgi:MarR family transcriptional regulator, organic hydroperoxide resistance regulator